MKLFSIFMLALFGIISICFYNIGSEMALYVSSFFGALSVLSGLLFVTILEEQKF